MPNGRRKGKKKKRNDKSKLTKGYIWMPVTEVEAGMIAGLRRKKDEKSKQVVEKEFKFIPTRKCIKQYLGRNWLESANFVGFTPSIVGEDVLINAYTHSDGLFGSVLGDVKFPGTFSPSQARRLVLVYMALAYKFFAITDLPTIKCSMEFIEDWSVISQRFSDFQYVIFERSPFYVKPYRKLLETVGIKFNLNVKAVGDFMTCIDSCFPILRYNYDVMMSGLREYLVPHVDSGGASPNDNSC